jgi:hypothetical protein
VLAKTTAAKKGSKMECLFERALSLSLLFLLFLAANPSMALEATTTLNRLTSNNTSASSSFAAVSNGDIAPGNVSKVSLKKMLPANFNGKVLAHWMPWWKCSESPCDGVHDKRDVLRVHYSTEDPGQLDKIVEDMISRGYDGIMVAEANSGGADTAGTVAMSREMPKFPNFYFSVSENHLNKIHSASEQFNQLMSDMAFADSHYFRLQNYLRIDGRPVVYIFDNGSIDWARAEVQAPGHPLFILDGPSHASDSMGGFYWFGGLPHNAEVSSATALSKLDSFYSQVAANPGRLYSGSFFKGFDDRYAPWSQGRVVDQACGLTFVRSLSAVSTHLASSPSNLPLLQVATWNDYEEGTEVETGIDNCAAVSAGVSGTVVTPVPSFTGVGSEETVDHYEVYLSRDGKNLMDAGSVAVGGASLDVNTLGLASAAYRVYVQMVGKSHILNHISPQAEVAVGGASIPGQSSADIPPPADNTASVGSTSSAGSTTSVSNRPLVDGKSSTHISVSSPAEGSSISNPVTLTISTDEPFAVARIQVWDRGVKIVDQINSPSVNASGLQLSKGVHTLTINVKDTSMKTKDSLTVTFQVE